ncbi:two-component regulator propeller domain-containing protein [Rhodocytophaga aerolata]|uniref:Two-component regulator propeller domain-containing protein n=1 Tax=Rhodocytophaga aerolata TaxID=455078 RepID=A0ABT8R9T9_9BACT|nr:sensor histidine kinase [Rhodocytophaga aerolata]MDO1447973.1 two-component regulator propeller domain-containing protein [Rhodocytophaga aerolata]
MYWFFPKKIIDFFIIYAFNTSIRWLWLLFCLVHFSLSAQYNTANFDHISVEDGLSQSEVYTILKDKQGFMWFGTVDGLNKYNGYTFIHYKHDPYDSTSLSNNQIHHLHEDKVGNLWVGTLDGLNRLDKTTNTFVRFPQLSADTASADIFPIFSIYEDQWQSIWLGTVEGLKRMVFDKEKNEYQIYTYKPDSTDASSISNHRVFTIFEDKEGKVWLGTAKGLNQVVIQNPDKHPSQQKLSFVHAGNSSSSLFRLSDYVVTAITEDHFGNLWVGTTRGLNRIDKNTSEVQHFYRDPDKPMGLSDNVIKTLLVDQKGDLWIGTQSNGICKIIMQDKHTVASIIHIKDDFFATKGLKSNMIFSLYESKDAFEDVVWIGTRGAGVHKYSRAKNKFVFWNRFTSQEKSFATNSTFAIYTDKEDNLWIGTQKGLVRINRKTNQYKKYTYDPKNTTSISDDMVERIYEDKQGTLWVGTHFGLNKFDRQKETFTRIYFNNHQRKYMENEIMYLYEDSQNNFWIGTGFDLKKYDRATGETKSYWEDTGLKGYFITSILEDKQQNLWIGSLSGLSKFDRQSETFTQYLHQENNPYSISSNMVWSVLEDKQGNLWFSTDQGINKLEVTKGNERFIHYSEKSGLSNNYVYGALLDDKGRIWMSTNLGISRFDPVSKQFKNYDVTDGLPNNEFNSGAYHRSEKGEMFFGGNSGVVSFDPDSISDNQHVPKIQLTSFKIFEKPINLDSLLAAQGEIRLNYKENFFSFDFVALDYTNPRKNQYAFKLDNFQDEWMYAGNRRYASFTNLSPGEYTFRVKGSNSDGIWSDQQEAVVKLIITPPFWRTYWFYLATFAVLAIAIKLSYDYRVKQKVHHLMEIEKAKLTENERVRKLAAQDLHDEFGNRLTRISLITELIKARLNGHGAEVDHLLTKIRDNSNQLYQGTKDFIWSINPENDSLYEVAIRLKDFGDDLFEKTDVCFEVMGISEELRPVMLPMGDSRHLILLFKEGMSNILKHAKARKVRLQFGINHTQMSVSLSDDGLGFEKEKEKGGNGLMNMQSRSKKLQGHLLIESVPGAGTCIKFVLQIPQPVH